MSKDSPWDLRLLVTLIVVVVTRNTNIEYLKFQGSGHITSRHFIPHDLLISRHFAITVELGSQLGLGWVLG